MRQSVKLQPLTDCSRLTSLCGKPLTQRSWRKAPSVIPDGRRRVILVMSKIKRIGPVTIENRGLSYSLEFHEDNASRWVKVDGNLAAHREDAGLVRAADRRPEGWVRLPERRLRLAPDQD